MDMISPATPTDRPVTKPPVIIRSPQRRWADAIAARVNAYGLGPWLVELGAWIGLDEAPWLPQSPEDGHLDIPSPLRALQLRVYALDSFTRAPKRFRLNHVVLERVAFNARMVAEHPDTCALPFGLDPRTATAQAIEAILAPREVKPDPQRHAHRVCYTLDDGRVVGVDFARGGSGIEYVHVLRPAKPTPWT